MSESRVGPSPALLLDGRGMALAFSGALGPTVALYQSWSREQPHASRLLARAGAELGVTPALARVEGGVLAVHCEEEGAFGTVIADDGSAREATLLVPGARALALAFPTLFAADADGIVSVEVDRDGRPAGEIVRRVSERRGAPRMSAAVVRDERLCVFAFASDASWGSISIGAGRKGEGAAANVVRHRTAKAVSSIHVAVAGGRAGLALGMEGGEVRFGVLGTQGKVGQRPHPVFPHDAGPLAEPRAVWIEQDFAVVALERSAGDAQARLLVQPVGEKGTAFALPRAEGAPASAYFGQHLHALEIGEGAEGDPELKLWRVGRDGRGPQRRVDPIEVDGAQARRDLLTARHLLGKLRQRLEGARGYRDDGARAALPPGGSTLTWADADGRVRVSLARDEGRWCLSVGSELGADEAEEEAPGSLMRLARWVRARFDAAAREAEERQQRWAGAAAARLDATVRTFESAGAALRFELELPDAPDLERLDRWLRELRRDHLALRP